MVLRLKHSLLQKSRFRKLPKETITRIRGTIEDAAEEEPSKNNRENNYSFLQDQTEDMEETTWSAAETEGDDQEFNTTAAVSNQDKPTPKCTSIQEEALKLQKEMIQFNEMPSKNLERCTRRCASSHHKWCRGQNRIVL